MTSRAAQFFVQTLLLCGLTLGWAAKAQMVAPGPKDAKPMTASATEASNGLLQRYGFSPNECPAFTKVVAEYQAKFNAPMKTWAGQHTARLNAQKVVYPFSGADIVTVVSIFPEAKHLILVADQWPEYASNKPVLAGQAEKECATMLFFARYGYFRTNDLEGKNSVKPRFIKLLTYNLALSDAKVHSIDYLAVDERGTAVVHSKLEGIQADGLRFSVTSSNRRELMIDYIRMDLSNNGLQPGKKFHAFMSAQIDDAVMVKSASHLLQKTYFSSLASIITNNSKSVVQDETGLDIDALRKPFNVRSYGKFYAPHPLWQDSASGQRLIKYLSDQLSIEPLPFIIGYEKKSGSVLLVADRKAAP
jgi:hypothetical protein